MIISIDSLFMSHSFSYIKRHGNIIGHGLTKKAKLSFPILVGKLLNTLKVL